MLLVDFLEDTAEYLREKIMKLHKLDQQYRRLYSKDIKTEMNIVKGEIRKKRAEVTRTLLLHLEEFRYLHKYFPELLQTFMEDEYIGKIISRKAWLLDFKQIPPSEAAKKFDQIRKKRIGLKDAKKFLRQWIGVVEARAFTATYPVLKGYMSDDMEKEEVIDLIIDVDRELRKEGWKLLITDSLIHIPISKFMEKINKLKYAESMAKLELNRTRGKGTVAETKATHDFNRIQKARIRYEGVLTQIFLANPAFLNGMKKKKNWLSRERQNALENFVENIVPYRVKERAWLDEMHKKLGLDGEPEEKKSKKNPKKTKKKKPVKKSKRKKRKKK